jgi:hypothetical protein
MSDSLIKELYMSEKRKVVVRKDNEMAEKINADTVEIIMETDDLQEGDIIMSGADEDESFVEEAVTPAEATTIEELSDDQVIFENGPTAGQVKAWKQQFGEVYVTSISFDKHIIWRVLSRMEYKQLVKKMETLLQAGQLSSAEANMWNEEAIAELCILFPSYDKKALTSEMAGLPSLISQEVLEASGFVALEVRQL